VIGFFKSYGFRLDEKLVKKWVMENYNKTNNTGESRPSNGED
jgi:hypothetical protein